MKQTVQMITTYAKQPIITVTLFENLGKSNM